VNRLSFPCCSGHALAENPARGEPSSTGSLTLLGLANFWRIDMRATVQAASNCIEPHQICTGRCLYPSEYGTSERAWTWQSQGRTGVNNGIWASKIRALQALFRGPHTRSDPISDLRRIGSWRFSSRTLIGGAGRSWPPSASRRSDDRWRRASPADDVHLTRPSEHLDHSSIIRARIASYRSVLTSCSIQTRFADPRRATACSIASRVPPARCATILGT
jgi:hypothetical protein